MHESLQPQRGGGYPQGSPSRPPRGHKSRPADLRRLRAFLSCFWDRLFGIMKEKKEILRHSAGMGQKGAW